MPVSMRTLYERYSPAMALLEVLTPEGDIKAGSAFHLGEGKFATARHVVQGTSEVRAITEAGVELVVLDIIIAKEDDVAVVLTDGRWPEEVVPLGSHLDDWIDDDAFYLAPVLVMGYPPIPFANAKRLVAVSGEINAVIDRHDLRHPHFIISPLPRGGFSGGPAIVAWEFCLGVISQDLRLASQYEPGFTAVISVEPLWDLLEEAGIRPADQDALDHLEP